jgi:site-specific DNA recombinase
MDLAGYGRVSDDYQAERATIKTQVKEVEAWAARNGHRVVRWYLDDPEHSYVPVAERKNGGKLLADAKLGIWRGVVVYSLDRWGRKPSVIYPPLDDLFTCDIQFFQVGSESDILSDEGELTFAIKAGVARYDHRRLLKKMVDGRNTCVDDGAWVGGIVPYGYTLELRRQRWYPVASEEPILGCEEWSEAAVIRAIYSWCVLEQMTGMQIARRLTAAGIPTHMRLRDRRNRKEVLTKAGDLSTGLWHPTRVREILANPMYKGLHVFGHQSKKKDPPRIERAVPALVSEELWDAAQAQLAANKSNSRRNAKQDYLLARKLYCVHCSRGFTGTQRPNGHLLAEGWAYVCNRKKNEYWRKDLPSCPLRPLREAVEKILWERIEEGIRNPGAVAARLREQLGEQAQHRGEWVQAIAQLRKLQEGLNARMARAEEAYLAEVMSLDRYRLQLDKIREDGAALAADIASHQSRLASLEDQERQSDAAVEILTQLRGKIDQGITWKTRREIVERIVERVNVFPPSAPGSPPRFELVLRFVGAPYEAATPAGGVIKCSLDL